MADHPDPPWLHWSSPKERTALLQAMAEEWDGASAGWMETVLAHAQEPLERPAVADLEVAAAQAAASGDWRRAGLLYRQLLRPTPQARLHPHDASLRRPGLR